MTYNEADHQCVMAARRKLLDRFPELFLECFDFSPPFGWLKVVGPLIERLAQDPECRVHQVKGKCGGLRVYLREYTDSQSRLIREAERACEGLCERCGASGASGGWVALCADCEGKR